MPFEMNGLDFYMKQNEMASMRGVYHNGEPFATTLGLALTVPDDAGSGYKFLESGAYGTTNGFGTSDVKMQSSVYQPVFCHPAVQQTNGYHPGMTGNGFSSPCTAPFGSRKRSLDDEDQDEFKRQRISGGYEASMMICSGGQPVPSPAPHNHQMAMAAKPEAMYSTSAMEHQTTMAVAKGYEDLYLYDIIAQMHGS